MPRIAQLARAQLARYYRWLLAARSAAPRRPQNPPSGAVAIAYPVTPRPAPMRPYLVRPRATNDARLTRALIVNWYNHQDQAARTALAAAGWPVDRYELRSC